jgi:monoamine oxidase
MNRRRLLRFAGACAAVGGIGVRNARADIGAAGGVVQPLDVAIVGAGLAGLTAARDLRQAGCESFVILEARNRVGGRTFNHDVGGGRISEGGGQWIGPGQTAVADLARELGVGTFPTYYEGRTVILGGSGRMEMDLKGTFGDDETIAAKLSALSRDVPSGAPWKSSRAAELDKLSLGDWLVTQKLKPEDLPVWNGTGLLTGGAAPAKFGFLHYLSMINSANCDFWQLDSIKDSAQGTRFIGGSQLLSIRMAQQLEPKVRLSCPVRRISSWDRDVVTLHTDQGEVRARRVVMAISPPLCQQIQFDPPLPQGRAALQRAWPAHSPMRKTVMVYSRPFWRDKGLNGSIYDFNSPVIWAYDNSPPRGEIGVINAFTLNALLPSEAKAAQRVQAEIYARALGREALAPLSYHDLDWGRVDPWTITCVSAIPPGFWTTHGESLHPPCGNLIWSGTETADIWAGYMDGAVRSGHHSALQVLYTLRRE